MPAPAYGAILAGLALAWLAGVGVQLRQAALWPQQHYLLALAAGVLGLGLASRLSGWRVLVVVLPAAALAGLSATGLQAGWRLADALPASLEGRDVVVTGVVASLPQAGPTGLRVAGISTAEAATFERDLVGTDRRAEYDYWSRRTGSTTSGVWRADELVAVAAVITRGHRLAGVRG